MYTTAQFQLYFIGLSVLCILGGLPLAMNLIKPNQFCGVRVRKTLSDERIWYIANSYAGKLMILTGIITIVLTVVLRLISMQPDTYGWICTFALVGGLVLTGLITLIYVKQIS